MLTHIWKYAIVCIVHTSARNGPFHGEVNGIDYCLTIFGALSHMCRVVNATCCYIALARWMLKNVVDVEESSTDLEESSTDLEEEADTRRHTQRKKSGMYATSKSCSRGEK